MVLVFPLSQDKLSVFTYYLKSKYLLSFCIKNHIQFSVCGILENKNPVDAFSYSSEVKVNFFFSELFFLFIYLFFFKFNFTGIRQEHTDQYVETLQNYNKYLNYKLQRKKKTTLHYTTLHFKDFIPYST